MRLLAFVRSNEFLLVSRERNARCCSFRENLSMLFLETAAVASIFSYKARPVYGDFLTSAF